MGITVGLLLWTWIILDSGVCSFSLPEITDGEFIDECVREHNRARSSVNPPTSNMLHMTWDEGLAITARAWARHCKFEHNIHLKDVRRVHPTFSSVGENIWKGSPPSIFDVTMAIKSWVNEKVYYDYQTNTCSPSAPFGCGHYTQVVWGSSYKVGCAAQLCQEGSFVIFLCNYATAGNIIGYHPYESQGAACSGCKGTCVDNLCHDRERDSQKRYKWTPDWDPVQNTAGSRYMTILIVRPIALIFTFITAYVVRYFYPDVFCYE